MLSSPSRPSKTLTLLAVCLGTFMLIIDVQIVVVALPSIRAALHTSFSDEQWTIDAYSLSLAALLLPAGSLADILGRRRVFAVGLAAFTAGSLLCGVAGSGLELILFRALQGIGGATVFATSLALLAQTFEGRGFGIALGIWSAVVTLGLGCGPVLGGLLTEVSWRLIFFVNIPVGVVAILMTLIGVQEFRPPDSRRIDLPGGAIYALGLVALIYGLIESSSSGWGRGRAGQLPAHRAHASSADVRPVPAAQADVRWWPRRRARDERVAVRDPALPRPLPAERAARLGARHRPPASRHHRRRDGHLHPRRAPVSVRADPLADRPGSGPHRPRPAAHARPARRHRVDPPHPRQGDRRRGQRPGQPAARLDRRGRGPAPARGPGLRDQRDLPPDRDRHLGGRAPPRSSPQSAAAPPRRRPPATTPRH